MIIQNDMSRMSDEHADAGPLSAEGDGVQQIPAGQFYLSPTLDTELRSACRAPPRQGEAAHPILAFVVALGGLGVDVAEICQMCGSSIEAGPLLASCRISYHRPMAVDLTYHVRGEVSGVTRKASRRFGMADHVSLRMSVTAGTDSYADVALAWIMPRLPL